MGSSTSRPTPLSAPFQRMKSWDLKAARRLLQDYKDKDLDFGLDTQALSELIQDDKEWAEDIILAFGSTNGIVNALAFICGVCLVCSGPALEKAAMVFDALDFDATEQISMDEMTIVFLCCARGFCVISGVGSVPSDEVLEAVTVQAYRELNKSSTQSISKSEFTAWTLRFAAAGASGEVTLDQMTQQFCITSKSSQEEVATSNNDVDIQVPSQSQDDMESPGANRKEQDEDATESKEIGEAREKEALPEPTVAEEQTHDEVQPSGSSAETEEHAPDMENQEQSLPANEENELAMKEPSVQGYDQEQEHDMQVNGSVTEVRDHDDPYDVIQGNPVDSELEYEETALDELRTADEAHAFGEMYAPSTEAEYHEEKDHEESYEPDHEQFFAADDQTYAEEPTEHSVAKEEEAEQQPDYELEFSTETPRPDGEAFVAGQTQPQEPAADLRMDEGHEYYDDEPEEPTPRSDDEILQPESLVENPAEAAVDESTVPEPATEAEGDDGLDQYEDDQAEPIPRQAEEDAQPELLTTTPCADEENLAPQDPDVAEENYYGDDPEVPTPPQMGGDSQLEISVAEPSVTNEDPVDAEAALHENEDYERTYFATESTAVIHDEDAPADAIHSSRSDASDLNHFDQYDYTDRKYSAESGLPPPEDD